MSVYTVVKQSPMYRQMTLEEFLFGSNSQNNMIHSNATNTRTYKTEAVSPKLINSVDIRGMVKALESFDANFDFLRTVPRGTLYCTFYQPKKKKGMPTVFDAVLKSQGKYVNCDAKAVCRTISEELIPLLKQHQTSNHDAIFNEINDKLTNKLEAFGFDTSVIDLNACIQSGFRRIDAPNAQLKTALFSLKCTLEGTCGALYHTSAFAYIKGRSTLKAMKRHQKNESKWFLKLDLSNFFGSTTLEFVMRMLSMIFPFCEIVKTEGGRIALESALELGFLNGTLPQGTPLSPTLTNIMMIPIDYHLTKALRDFAGQSYVYTRYSDDTIISSKYNFNYHEVEGLVISTLKEFDAPFNINTKKTRYGSSNGSNWNLGVMLNNENNITVGFRNKRAMKAALHSYALDKKSGKPWGLSEVQKLSGILSYYMMVEKDTVTKMIQHVCNGVQMDILEMIKQDLKTL